jgi:hypothetical protein
VVEAERLGRDGQVRVTEAEVVYVAVDKEGTKIRIKRADE